MAFVIKCKDSDEAAAVAAAIDSAVARSRFRLEHPIRTVPRRGGRADVLVEHVRLRVPKPYCGNHPGPCRIDPRFERPHRKLVFCEGLDWVSWNDLVNDVLDRLRHGGDAASRSVVIRRAGRRRVVYGERYLAFNHVDWDPDGENGDYQDCRGRRPPPSDYPSGTPGIYGYAATDREAG